jgi:beta-glucosidase
MIPPSAYSTDDGTSGLTGEYFPNKEFKGPALVVRRDNYINLEALPHDQDSLTQPPGLTDFSVRWTGFLTPDRSAAFQMFTTGHTNRLWLDGRLLVDDLAPEGTLPTPVVSLEKGHRYALRLESVVQDDGGSQLLWLLLISDPLSAALKQAMESDVIIAVVGITRSWRERNCASRCRGSAAGTGPVLISPRRKKIC